MSFATFALKTRVVRGHQSRSHPPSHFVPCSTTLASSTLQIHVLDAPGLFDHAHDSQTCDVTPECFSPSTLH